VTFAIAAIVCQPTAADCPKQHNGTRPNATSPLGHLDDVVYFSDAILYFSDAILVPLPATAPSAVDIALTSGGDTLTLGPLQIDATGA
jgi:hypothetical protein